MTFSLTIYHEQQVKNHPWLGLMIVEQKALRRSSSCSTQPSLAEDINRKGFNGGPTCAATLVGGLSFICYYDVITPSFSDWEQLFHHSSTLSSRY